MNGTVKIRYRPIETMDRLHVLLAGSATLEDSSFESISTLFSLPTRIIKKECTVLETYGIGRMSDGCFRLTDRGADVLSTWHLMGQNDSLDIETSAKAWTLGPGSFEVPGTIRDFQGCKHYARQYEISDAVEAGKFIRRRHELEIELEAFLACAPAPLERDEKEQKWTMNAEAIIGKIGIAESNDSIDRLKEMLHSLFKIHDDGGEKFIQQKQSLLEAFNEQSIKRSRENRRLVQVKAACESLLIRDWLRQSAVQLLDRFDDEPGAFIFDSSVPVVVMADKPRTEARPQQSAPRTTAKQEGLLRSLFRWFTG